MLEPVDVRLVLAHLGHFFACFACMNTFVLTILVISIKSDTLASESTCPSVSESRSDKLVKLAIRLMILHHNGRGGIRIGEVSSLAVC